MNIEQLPKRIRNKIQVNEDTGCWEWTAGKRGIGYGQLWDTKVKANTGAHQLIYELLVKPVPEGQQIDHLCRVIHCVNPEHLEAVPPSVNLLRGHGSSVQTHNTGICKRGHTINKNNELLATSKDGTIRGRQCLTCQRNASKEWHRKQAAELKAKQSNQLALTL